MKSVPISKGHRRRMALETQFLKYDKHNNTTRESIISQPGVFVLLRRLNHFQREATTHRTWKGIAFGLYTFAPLENLLINESTMALDRKAFDPRTARVI